jgi:cytochrome c oxidase cbb3-type subunit 4
MLKFIKGYVSSIDGIEIYPIISFIIFFTFFILVTFYVITAKKKYIDELSNLPFDDGNPSTALDQLNNSDQ